MENVANSSVNYVIDQFLNAIAGFGKVGLVLAIYLGIAWLINRLVNDRLRSSEFFLRYGRNGSLFVFRLVSVGIYVVAVLGALARLGVNTSGILTLVSAFTVAVGLSLQDVLRNLFAGMFMLAERPFSVGDRIIVRDKSGTVQGIDVRTTRIRTDDGTLLMVPNQLLFTEILQNDSRYHRKASRFLITCPLSGEELLAQVGAVVADLDGVDLLTNSLQLEQYAEASMQWELTFIVNSRLPTSYQQLADRLVSAMPDYTITRVTP